MIAPRPPGAQRLAWSRACYNSQHYSGLLRLQRSLYLAGYRGPARRAEEAARRGASRGEADSVIILALPDWSVERAIVVGPPVLPLERRIVV